MNSYQSIVEEVRKIGKEHLSYKMIKEKGSVEEAVTDSDVSIQRELMLRLSEIVPGSQFYCEEEGFNSSKKAEYLFIIDPIDGTMNYTRGISECAISLALLHNNEPVFSCVYNLFRDEMFYAIKGKGAYYQGRKIHVSDRDFKHSIFFTGFSLYEKKYAKECIELTEDVYMNTNDVRRFGSAALELCYIALGRGELYFAYRLQPYDFSGGELILKEAGGVISSLHGKKVTHDKPQLIIAANNLENLTKLSEIVSKHIPYVKY